LQSTSVKHQKQSSENPGQWTLEHKSNVTSDWNSRVTTMP